MISRSIFKRHALLPLLWLCATGSLGATEPPSLVQAIGDEVKSCFEQSRQAVVKIRAKDEHGALAGSGFFFDPTGTLYTAYAVGGESWDIQVQVGDQTYSAHRLVADARSGIAILKVNATTPFLAISNAPLQLATPVITVGYPLDLPAGPNFGVIAGFDLKYLGRYFATTHIRANVPVHRGQAGAPLLNLKGEVVGILISSLNSGSSCYALPIAAAEKIRADYLRSGAVLHAWVGMQVADGQNSVPRVEITALEQGSPAKEAGVRSGELLRRIGNHTIQHASDVVDAAFFLRVGEPTPVVVQRGGSEITLVVEPGAYPFGTQNLAGAARMELARPD